jgi:TolB-like protein/DNA-binding winged helix-turn-helix (wHTH) protein
VLYTFDQFILDTSRFELSENGNAIPAEPQVIELLTFFVRNSDRLITRDELIESVWKGRVVSDSAISGCIKITRKILGDNGRQQKYIRTIHKKGFSFVAHAQAKDTVSVKTKVGPDPASHVFLETGVNRRNRDPRPSIGVLKFASLSEGAGKDYFADGLTEDLITTLSKISKLIVVTHPESLQSDNNVVNAARAGVELDVRYILYGSVRNDGKRLRISVYLVETRSGQYLWAQRYDCLNKEIFELQDEVTKAVVSALQVELTEGDQALLLSRGTENIEAWQLTFQGQAAVLEHHQDSVRRGLQQLQLAVSLDQDYALAWSALGVAHWKESLNEGWSDSRETSLKLSVEASDRALVLEPKNASILAMRSLILVSHRNFNEALELAKQALYYANSEASTIAIAGITLRACCQPELSIMHTRKAMELSPIYPAWYPYGISICYWMQGELDLAIELAREAIEIDPGLSVTYFALAMIYAESGQIQLARDAVAALLLIDPQFSSRAFTQGMPFSDPVIEARREAALNKAGMPD